MEATISSDADISSALVHSFAKPVAVNTNLQIESLIFDLSEFESPINIVIGDEEFTLDNDFIYREYDGGFLLDPDIADSGITVQLQAEEPFLVLSSATPMYYSSQAGDEPDSDIIELLTERLHKALLENGVGYAQNKFYELKLPVENQFNIASSQLANVVVGLDSLTEASLDEKGLENGVYQVVNQGFSTDSVFHLLDQIKANSLPNPSRSDLGPFNRYIPEADLVLNTDMGTEPADFILSSPDKLVYVHIKCGKSQEPQSSAGALAEVGSQAIKNIEMLISGNNNLRAANWSRLLGPWPQRGAAQLMNERIRMFEGQAFTAANENERELKTEEVWNVIAQRRRSSTVSKEVWIVAANSFSANHFEAQLQRGHNAQSTSLQAYQLIQSWMSTAHSNDVELKIFVSQ